MRRSTFNASAGSMRFSRRETSSTCPMRQSSSLQDEDLTLAKRAAARDLAFKVYLRPAMITDRAASQLARLGIRVVFIGYESIMCFALEGERHRKRASSVQPATATHRIYPERFTVARAISEVELLGRYGISVIPSFVLGLPGEDQASLRDTAGIIEAVSELQNVRELCINPLVPLPGSAYYSMCLRDQELCDMYEKWTGRGLAELDNIDFPLLTELFVARFTHSTLAQICDLVSRCSGRSGLRVATWHHWDSYAETGNKACPASLINAGGPS